MPPLSSIVKRTLLVAILAILPVVAFGNDGEKKNNWLFVTGKAPMMSNALNCGALAVSVIIDSKPHPGLYITTPTGGLGYKMGLQKGAVLLALDDHEVNSAAAVDAWLSRRPMTPLKFSYVIMRDGKPAVHKGEIPFERQSAPVSPLPAQQQMKTSSIDELERYCATLINASRKSDGKAEVQIDSALSRVARNYADYMLKHSDAYGFPLRRNPHIDLEGKFPMQRSLEAGIMTEVHENLGMESRGGGTSDADLVLRQHNMMMSEPPGQHNHRSILLDGDALKVGVGISRDETHLYLVEEFGH